ncbi:CDP-glucose 4,6-dehydratase [Chengkuizengella axinellae]|uniref:CDP-glucose 4,6-dehydratase n=1 Tax=Chengkuizengella axinellae TaxID=3064388 RepID=A0ABT9J1K9_9BACL|nr:CDP-glucose 4,6-dehydratase [Chengkuizengella sp. 2205SS18-9]MDP5275499.1 CDP-glucose 4,6-dehydratase [Chengkuizengella sp. 2205SS18-9]
MGIVKLSFYKDKKIFVTGHTGFKGTWLCKMLINAGAEVTGYALKPPTNPSLFELSSIENEMESIIHNIRDIKHLEQAFSKAQPEIVIHLAAQPLVLESYALPHQTYETNIMGTVNLLECIRKNNSVQSVLVVTTDKVYENNEWIWGYRENDTLGGHDPYSSSKSCSELITNSYNRSYFIDRNIAISTVRAGNVIGGGDFAKNRIVPDCIRAAEKNTTIIVRNPNSKRHYQHVIEALYAYLMIIQKQYNNLEVSSSYNVAPDDSNCISTITLVCLFCEKWKEATEIKLNWSNSTSETASHESTYLILDNSKFKHVFNWQSKWSVDTSIKKTIEWTIAYLANENISSVMDKQILDFINDKK